MSTKKNVNSDKQNEPYSFMKETTKKRPAGRKTWIRRILITAAFAMGAGLLAALVFVLSVPVFDSMINGKNTEPEIIAIASASETEEAAKGEQVEEPEPEATVEEPEETEEEKREEALRQYKAVFQGMMDDAKEANRSIVDVVTITSQIDYFNHNYENQQQVSGLLIAESKNKLYCLTENRDLKNAEDIHLTMCDDSTVKASYHSSDPETNLAILTIQRSDLSEETLNKIRIAELGNSNIVRQGDPVVAVGSLMGLGGSVEYGIITSVKNSVSLWDASYNILLTDMMGSSVGSGVLITTGGEVIGVICQRFSPDSQNMITALPIRQLSTLVENLINKTHRIRIGIKMQTVDSNISESTGIPRGVLVSEVEAESPAMYAGIKEYDVITQVGDQEILTIQQFERAVSSLTEDSVIQIQGMRMGKEAYEEISFELRPET